MSSQADEVKLGVPAIPYEFAKPREAMNLSSSPFQPSFAEQSIGFQSVFSLEAKVSPNVLLLEPPAASQVTANSSIPLTVTPPPIRLPVSNVSKTPSLSAGLVFLFGCGLFSVTFAVCYFVARRLARAPDARPQTVASLERLVGRVDGLFSSLSAELHEHLKVLLLTTALGVSVLVGALAHVVVALRYLVAAVRSPAAWRRLAGAIATLPSRLSEMVVVRRNRRQAGRWALTLAMIGATMITGVPSNTFAANYIFDMDGSPTNRVTEWTGTPLSAFNWNQGTSQNFFNPLDSTENLATSNDIIQFGNGATLGAAYSVLIGSASTVNVSGLIFGSNGGFGYALTGNGASNVLSLGSAGITLNTGAQPTTVGSFGANALSITVAAPQTWTNNSTSIFTVGGVVNLGTNALTLGNNTTGTQVFNQAINGTGSVGLIINGTNAAAVTLNAANGYTGETRIVSGSLTLGAAATLASTVINIGYAGILAPGVLAPTAPTLNTGATGNLVAGALVNLGTAGAVLNLGANLALNNAITGIGTINLSTFTLTFGSGATDSAFGGVNLGGITGSGLITKNGTGVFTLGGTAAANTYTSQFNVAAGTLKLAGAGALGAVGGATVLTSGATLDLAGFSTADPLTIAGAGVGSNGALINSGSGTSTVSGAVTFSTATIGGTGQILFSTASLAADATALTKIGTGIAIFSGAASSRTGTTTVSAGTLRLVAASGTTNPLSSGAIILNGTGVLSLAPTTASGNLAVNVNANAVGTTTILTDSGFVQGLQDLTFGAGATGLTLMAGPVSAVNVANGATFTRTITLSGNTTFTIVNNGVVNAAAGLETLTLATLADGGVARTIVKEGGGILALTGTGALTTANNILTINRGFVTSSAATSLGSGALVTVNNNATFTVNTAAQTIGSLSGSGRVTIATATFPLTVGNATSTTFDGLLTNTGGLTKVGAGMLTLSGPNTGAGLITVSAGTLQALDLNTVLGTAPITLGTTSTLDIRANTSQAYATGTLTINGTTGATASVINVQNNGTGSNNVLTLNGALAIAGNQLNVTGANGYWLNIAGIPTLTGTPTLNIATGMTLQLSGIIAGAGNGITKTGPGMLVLTAANVMSGTTSLNSSAGVNAGTLRGLVAGSFGTTALSVNTSATAGVGATLELLASTNASTAYTTTTTTIANSSSLTITADILNGITGISGYGNGYSNQQPIGTPAVTHTLGTGILTLGTASTLTVNSANYDGVGVTFAGATINGTSGASSSVINVGGGALYSQVTLNGLTMSGTSVLDINTAGSGTVLLNAATGAEAAGSVINVNGGTLRLGQILALGGSTNAQGALVNVKTGATLEIAGVVATAGMISLASGSTLRGTGTAAGFNNTFANSLSIASGASVTLQTSTNSIAFVTAALSGTSDVFTITNGINFAGAANVAVSGLGRIVLGGAATTNNGTWTINSGVLQLGNVGALGLTAASSPVSINGGALSASVVGTFANNITLNGGSLAGAVGAPATNPIFSGTVAVGVSNSTIFLQDPSTLTATARSFDISGALTSTASNLNLYVTGLQAGGVLTLNNTANTFNGNMIVTNATVSLGRNATVGTGAWLPTSGTPTLTLNQGGALTLDNTVATVADRLKDTGTGAVAISMLGGTINLTNQSATPVSEAVAGVTLLGGFNTFNINRTGAANVDLTLASLAGLTGTTSVAAFTGSITPNLGGGAGAAHVYITSLGTGTSAFLGANYLASAGSTTPTEFAAYDGTTANVGVVAYTAGSTNLVTVPDPLLHVRITGNPSDTITTKTVNSLNLAGAATVTMRDNAQILTLTSGGLLSSTANTITGGGITAGANPLYVNNTASTLLLNSFITGTASTVGVVYSGAGVTTLGSSSLGGSLANDYTGSTTLNNGGLTLARAPGITAVPGTVLNVVSGTLTLTNAEQIADAMNVTINNLNATGVMTLGGAGVNETIKSLTLVSTTAGAGVGGTGTLILTSTDTNALTVTGGTVAAPLRFTGTSGGGIKFLAPTTILAPTLAVNAGLGGPYQSIIGAAAAQIDLNSTGTGLTRTIDVDNGPALIDLNFNGALTASGAQTAITKTGAGTMRLNVASTYTGLTTVNQGTLSFNVANGLGVGSLTLAPTNGGNVTVNLSSTSTNTVTVNSVPTGLTIGSTLLNSTVTNIVGNTITLAANANQTIGTGTSIPFGVAAMAQFDIAAAVNPLATTLTIPTLAPNTVTVSGGTLEFNNFAQTIGKLVYSGGTINLPTSGLLSLQNPLNNTTVLQLDSTNGPLTLRGNLSLAGAAVINNVTTTGNNMVTLDGALALAGPRNFIVADGTALVDLDVTASLSGAGILIKSGDGTMRLSGGLVTQNVNSGAVVVNAGTLALAKTGVFGATGGVAIGTGQLVIGDNFGNAATVRLDADEQINNAAASVITVNAGGTFNLQSFSETIGGPLNILSGRDSLNAVKMGSVTGTSGSLYTAAVNMMGGSLGMSTTGTIFLGGNVTATSYSTNAAVISGKLNLGTASRTFTVVPGLGGAAVDLSVTGVISGNNIGITKLGVGVMSLAGANTYTGTTAINAGTLKLSSTASLSANSAISFINTMTGPVNPTLDLSAVNQTLGLPFGPSTPLTQTANLGSLTGGAIGSPTVPYVVGKVAFGDRTLVIGTDETSPAAFLGALVGTTGNLFKTGLGTLALGNNSFSNSWTGTTTVNQGMLMISAAHALPLTTAVTVSNGGALYLLAQPQMLKSLQVDAGGTLNGSTGTLTINTDDSTTALAGFIHGGFTLNKAGTGTVSITGNQNTFTGAINVNQGTLTLSGLGVLPTVAAAGVTVNPGGILRLDNSGTNNTDRLAATLPMTLQGGTFRIDGFSTAASGEQLGLLTLAGGASTINLVNGAGAGSSLQLSFNGAVARTGTGGTLNVTTSGLGTLGSAGANPRLLFMGQAIGTIGYMTVTTGGVTTFATYDAANGVSAVLDANTIGFDALALQTTFDTKFTGATVNNSLFQNTTINTLRIESSGAGKFLELGTNTLTITAGGIMLNGSDDFEIKRSTGVGSLAAANGLNFFVNGSGVLTVSAPISGVSPTGATVATVINKSGSGKLILSAPSTFPSTSASAIFVNEGTLAFGADNTVYAGNSAPALFAGPLTVNNPSAVLDLGGFNNAVGSLTISAGSLVNTGAGGSLTLANVASGVTGALTLGGGYGANGAASINTGTGTLFLSGGGLTFNAANDAGQATIAGRLDLGSYAVTLARNFTIGDSLYSSLQSSAATIDLDVSANLTGGPQVGLAAFTKAG
ncbi:MAG: autotransporter-associated beta strand repeat-containing protein, partial [Planctomycetia bacterium]|nr:autotransporter-associated beta strand repeat-containing protein [Planctomycetia bacterium]